MEKGPIYKSIDYILSGLVYINLVELFKFLSQKLSSKTASLTNKRRNLRISVDLFILIKWIFIGLLVFSNKAYPITTIIAWYLIFTNLYTYFFYHTWSTDILKDKFFDIDRIKRRFLNLFLAIFFTIFTFAYLYFVPYSNEFYWESSATFLHSFWYSVSNSLTASYSQVFPLSDLGNSISMIQLLIMFLFLTIIIGGSVPQIPQSKE